MANREENLKKINYELEKMSDEELDQVAGGGFWDFIKNIPKTNGIPKEIIDKTKDKVTSSVR